ncbi:NADH-ubiquinone oxidoreductase 30.4 kDa subunit mitochondrial precursor [Myxozyma melibiosi]|uniref:NADH-ubiquinone oxidoreductase 30.4 kDa subunit mitochondrial n=1 Tax=Myxozyma melibiosi TaxID=54550 RepID=A0ABR1FA61_9ASCO
MIRSIGLRSAAALTRSVKPAVEQRRFAATFVDNIKEALKDDEGPLYPQNLKELPRTDPGAELHRPIVNPAADYAETVENLHEYGKYIMAAMPKYIQKFSVWKDELTLMIAPTAVIPVITFLKDHTAAQFKAVMDITAADYPTRSHRFDVVYNLLSTRYSSRIRVKTYASETTPVPSIANLYQGANWYERETYDMFGVFFVGHPDLRRIMTDYGFEGHPLRKDFPLTGYTEIRYDEEKKRIVYEPLEMTQAFRNFSVGSTVWEPVGPGKDERPKNFVLPEPEPEEAPEEKK